MDAQYLQDYADSLADRVAELEGHYRPGPADVDAVDALAALDALEVRAVYVYSGSGHYLDRVDVVATVGGPSAWLEFSEYGHVLAVATAAGQRRAERATYAPALAGDLWDTVLAYGPGPGQ